MRFGRIVRQPDKSATQKRDKSGPAGRDRQKPSMRGSVLVWALVLTHVGVGRTSRPITCKAGHFKEGESASVTCNFYHQVRHPKHHIYVVHYPYDAPKDFSGNDRLKCSRFHQQHHHCTVAEGYHFNNEISDQLTLAIPSVNKTFAGLYVCQMVPAHGRAIKTCNLTVEDTPESVLPTVWTPHINDTGTPTGSESSSVREIVVRVGMSAMGVLLICMVFYIFKLRRKHKADQSRAPPNNAVYAPISPLQESNIEKKNRDASSQIHQSS